MICPLQSPLLRAQTPTGKCSAERDSALQLLGEVCLQPLRYGGSTPSAALPPADTSGGLGVMLEQKVRALPVTLIMSARETSCTLAAACL